MTRARLCALLLWASNLSAAGVEKTYTLDDAQRLALLNDARVLSAEQDKIIAEERVREARYLFFPEFGLRASATKYDARYPFSPSGDTGNILLFPRTPQLYGVDIGTIYSGSGYMHMSLYEGRRTINTLRLAQAAQKQALTNHESVKMDLKLSVKEVFYRLILAQEKAAETGKYRAAVEDLAASGGLGQWERLETEALTANARAKASEARHERDLSRLAFLKSLNIELDTSFKVEGALEGKPVEVDVEKAVLWAMELRPELQSETYKAQMDAISVNLASARRNPTVFIAGDYGVTGLGFPLERNNWEATLGVKIPFDYDYWAQIREKKAEQRQGQLKRADLQDRVRLEVRQAYETLEYWQREWPLRESQYRKVAALYEEASRRSPAALPRIRALSGVLDLRISYLSAVTEHILARARLERAVGRELGQ